MKKQNVIRLLVPVAVIFSVMVFPAGALQAQSGRDAGHDADRGAGPNADHGSYHMGDVPIRTRWAKDVSPEHDWAEYPRPQMVRNGWENLNGLWEYAITAKDGSRPTGFNGSILVPFPIESALSGVQRPLMPNQALWYRRHFVTEGRKGRTLLHFGAVDYQCWVFVNGKPAGTHTGGYTEFSFDISGLIRKGENELLVKVYDPTDQGAGPRGKQVLHPQGIFYTASSGIWQTVWMEAVPDDYIHALAITPDIDRSEVNVVVRGPADKAVAVELGGKTYRGKANDSLRIPVTDMQLWTPAHPYLYDCVVRLGADEVRSYFGMRKISVAKDEQGVERICLNNKPYYNLGTLDQGFWPDGLYTAPGDEALSFDIKVIKAMGFNTIRKHIKVEPARWYYWADSLGMLVWQDMVDPNPALPPGSKEAFEQENKEILTQLHNHPSIVVWVLFNEKWGQYDQERLTKWIKDTDPSRLVNGHTGEYLYVNDILRSPSPNAYIGADLTDVHSYPNPRNALYMPGKARVLGEFGGIGVFIAGHQWNGNSAWGYIQEKPAALQAKYTIMNEHLQLLEREGLSGSIYTQPFDVEGEQNGLITYDREIIKIPLDSLRRIHAPLNPDMGMLPEVAIRNADLTDPVLAYSRVLQQYIDGERGAAFLQRMAMMASQAGDKEGARMAGDDFVAGLRPPYSKESLRFVLESGGAGGKAYSFVSEHRGGIDSLFGPRQAENRLMEWVYRDVLASAVGGRGAHPDWNMLAVRVRPYGEPGEEVLLRSKTLYFLNQQDETAFCRAADEYIDRYGDRIGAEDLNAWAWHVFLKSDDAAALGNAARWSRLSDPSGNNAGYMDTQANLLYKAGRKREAMSLEEKAAVLSGDPALQETLKKMREGRPTWD